MASPVALPERAFHLAASPPRQLVSQAAPPYSPTAPLQPLTPEEVAAIILVGEQDSRNWPESRKWLTTSVISLMGFVSPLGASILVPGSKYIDFEFELHSRVLSLLPVSMFVLGLGVGPFVLAPVSELQGRLPVYTITSLVFIAFNLGSSFSNSFAALNILRFLAGAAGSAGPSLGAGSIGDMFEPRERGRAQALYGLGPLMGPVLGNVIGGFIAQGDRDWRWLLFTLTIMSLGVFMAIVFLLRETYAPVLLRRKREKAIRERLQLVAQQNPAILPNDVLRPPLATRAAEWARKLVPSPEARTKIKHAQSRPFRLLFTNPICAIQSLYLGFCYGIVFLFLTQHPLLFQKREPNEGLPNPEQLPTYNWNMGVAGLSYLGLGIGFLASAVTNVLLQDNIYQKLVLTDGKVSMLLLKPIEEVRHIIEMDAKEKEKSFAAKQTSEPAPRETDLEKQEASANSSNTTSGDATPTQPMQKAEAESSGSNNAVGTVDAAASVPTWGVVPDPTATSSKVADLTAEAKPEEIPKPVVVSPPPPKKGRPEYRLPLCFVGMLILPVGLFCFGWSAESMTHWTVPLLGSLLVGYGTILCFQTILVYLVDAFVPYSASATACAVLVRSILAAVFPLIGEYMLEDLGYGWTSSLIAFIALAGAPIPLILYRYGERLRNKYRFNG